MVWGNIMYHNSNDWALSEEYRRRTQLNAEHRRLVDSIRPDRPSILTKLHHWVDGLSLLFVDDDPKLTRVPLTRSYIY